jgi:hypothetical protein
MRQDHKILERANSVKTIDEKGFQTVKNSFNLKTIWVSASFNETRSQNSCNLEKANSV